MRKRGGKKKEKSQAGKAAASCDGFFSCAFLKEGEEGEKRKSRKRGPCS